MGAPSSPSHPLQSLNRGPTCCRRHLGCFHATGHHTVVVTVLSCRILHTVCLGRDHGRTCSETLNWRHCLTRQNPSLSGSPAPNQPSCWWGSNCDFRGHSRMAPIRPKMWHTSWVSSNERHSPWNLLSGRSELATDGSPPEDRFAR